MICGLRSAGRSASADVGSHQRGNFISRVAFQRHDYEGVSSAGGEEVMKNLEAKLLEAQAGRVTELVSAENFS